VPQGGTGLVHGDLWQGNTLWAGERCEGILDWDAAGVGHPGIDLATLRLDAAVMFGLPAAAVSWRGGGGRPANNPTPWRRWPVERTHAWGNQYGKLRWCTERRLLGVAFWAGAGRRRHLLGRLVRRAWACCRWDAPPRRPP
jgi:aminoglycoside phosphotransferase (APT) family kinase protein